MRAQPWHLGELPIPRQSPDYLAAYSQIPLAAFATFPPPTGYGGLDRETRRRRSNLDPTFDRGQDETSRPDPR